MICVVCARFARFGVGDWQLQSWISFDFQGLRRQSHDPYHQVRLRTSTLRTRVAAPPASAPCPGRAASETCPGMACTAYRRTRRPSPPRTTAWIFYHRHRSYRHTDPTHRRSPSCRTCRCSILTHRQDRARQEGSPGPSREIFTTEAQSTLSKAAKLAEEVMQKNRQ